MAKPTIGLTGGIASGKSSVAKTLIAQGVGLVDADQLAREVVQPGTDGLAEVVATFGEQVLAADGSLDREKLAARVFDDDEAREKLQAITHPRIGRLSAERLAELQASDAIYVVYDAPLLVEVGAHKGMDALIVVAADVETQVARVIARDGATEEDARKRIAAQYPLERKVDVADYVIDNSGSLEQLEARTLEVHAAICSRFGLKPASGQG
ncbi:MAG: dephospho-CoA kinase [Myxococcales bacterium]|nr:dephospho-CoA kinase [Myxococcales bacterium]